MLKIINIICILLVIIIIACILESVREHNKFRTREYTVIDNKIPAGFDGTKLAVIADWHNASYGKDNQKFIKQVQLLQPDYIMIAGDMIVCRKHTEQKVKKTARLIKELSQIAPVYYAFGNHEFGVRAGLHDTDGIWDVYVKELDLSTNTNIHLLDNEHLILNKNNDQICVSGITLDREYFKRFFIKNLDSKSVRHICYKANTYNILLAHNPDYFYTYADAGANLIFAGHNHGGMIRIPLLGGVISPRFHVFPKFDRGRYEYGESTMILSGGLGTHSIPIRVNNVPELLCVLLHNATK